MRLKHSKRAKKPYENYRKSTISLYPKIGLKPLQNFEKTLDQI